jgi:hypothetical protein
MPRCSGALKQELDSRVELVTVDAHINDSGLPTSRRLVMHELMER